MAAMGESDRARLANLWGLHLRHRRLDRAGRPGEPERRTRVELDRRARWALAEQSPVGPVQGSTRPALLAALEREDLEFTPGQVADAGEGRHADDRPGIVAAVARGFGGER